MLKAFSVLEDCEYTGGIIFAKTGIEARRRGADEYNGGEFGGLIVRRMRDLDRFAATRKVPARLLVAAGWHFECRGCDMNIEEDELLDRRMDVDGVIGFEGVDVWCCKACCARDLRHRRREAQFRADYTKVLSGMVYRRFPEAEINGVHIYCTHGDQSTRGAFIVRQAVVAFGLPCLKFGDATMRIEERQWRHATPSGGRSGGYSYGPPSPAWYVCNGDREAFERYCADMARKGM